MMAELDGAPAAAVADEIHETSHQVAVQTFRQRWSDAAQPLPQQFPEKRKARRRNSASVTGRKVETAGFSTHGRRWSRFVRSSRRVVLSTQASCFLRQGGLYFAEFAGHGGKAIGGAAPDTLEEGKKLTPDQVPEEAGIAVGRVFPPILGETPKECQELGPPGAEQGSPQVQGGVVDPQALPGLHPAEARQRGTPDQSQQECFGLVAGMVTESDGIEVFFPGEAGKKSQASFAGPCLETAFPAEGA